MQYEVRTLSAANDITIITIDANDEQEARRQAERRALQPISIRQVALKTRPVSSHTKRFSLLLFSQEMLALTKAGLSLFEAVEALREKETASEICRILDRLLAALREGRRFSVALAEQGGYFPPLYVGLMQAAEGTSNLPLSLARFVEYQKRIDGIRGKIISASVYPIILMTVGGAVTVFLVGYVVPRFALVYQDTGRDLPWLSQMMIMWGQLAVKHASEFAAVAVASSALGFIGVRRLLRNGGFTHIASRLPMVGHQIHLYELSRLYTTLGMLLEGGIPATTAIMTACATVSAATRDRLLTAEQQIRSGRPLSVAFESNGLTTTISLRMLRVGEQSGQLGAMLTQAADFYEGDISRFVERFTRTFEPLLMTAIGLIVGFIVVLLYMPIFDLAGSLQ